MNMTVLVKSNNEKIFNSCQCRKKKKLNVMFKIRNFLNDKLSIIIVYNNIHCNKMFIKGNNIFISSNKFDKMLLDGNIFYHLLLNTDDDNIVYGLETFEKYKQHFLFKNDNKKIFKYIRIYLKLYSNLSYEKRLLLLFIFLQLLDGNSIFEVDTNLNNLEEYFINLNITILTQEELSNIYDYVYNKIKSEKLSSTITKLENKLFNYYNLFV